MDTNKRYQVAWSPVYVETAAAVGNVGGYLCRLTRRNEYGDAAHIAHQLAAETRGTGGGYYVVTAK